MLQKCRGLNSEIMLIGSPHQQRKAGTVHFIVDDSIVEFQTQLKKSVIFDSNLTFEPHFQNTVKTYIFHLRNIARLRSVLSFPVAEKLINTFVFSRIDYCNALLARVSQATLNKVQVVLNSTA